MSNHTAPPSPILVVADHKWRDLPGMALLKTILEDKYQLPTLVIGYGAVGACLRYFRPRALVLTTLISPREQDFARAAHAIGAAVITIPADPGSTESMKALLRSPEVWEVCDLYLAWGAAMAKLVVEDGYVPKDKVTVTGSGRFDFYQPPLRDYLLSREALCARYSLRSNCPIITCGTTFVLASYLEDEKRLRFNEKDFERRGLAHLPGFANVYNLAEKDKAAQDLVLDWIRQTCVNFPDAEFIVKPHPYESFAPYKQLWQACRRDGITNLHLAASDYIWDLLNNAVVHVHTGSTTGLEAWLMHVPTVNLQPSGYARFKSARDGKRLELDSLEDVQEDAKTLHERINFYLGGGQIEPALALKRKNFLEQWFYRLDGHAAERQAAAIADLMKNYHPKHNLEARLPWAGYRTLLTLLQYHINGLLGRDFDAPFFGSRRNVPVDFLGQRDKVVRSQDVVFWANRIREALKGPAKSGLESPDP